MRPSPAITRPKLTYAGSLLAPNVPDAGDSVAVLALAESRTTTTVIEVENSVNTLVITTNQASDRASRKALRARGNITGAVLTLLGIDTLVMVVVSIPVTVVVTTTVGVTRGSRGIVGGRSRGGRFAAERTRVPAPTLTALGRRLGLRGAVGSTAALDGEPRPLVGAVSVGGWLGRVWRPSIGKTHVFGVPPKNHSSAHVSPFAQTERPTRIDPRDSCSHLHRLRWRERREQREPKEGCEQ